MTVDEMNADTEKAVSTYQVRDGQIQGQAAKG